MQISNAGLQKIIQREGVFLHAYKDSVGVWTIGTGHTSAAGLPKVTPTLTITKQQNDQILRSDLAPIEAQAKKYIKVTVTQNQYDAIISIVFNVGPKFWSGTAIKLLNQGNTKGAANAIMLWNKPPEIIGRRRSEQQQFLTPDSNTAAHGSAGAVVLAGGAALTQTPHHIWPWIIGGTALAAIIIWLGVHIYKTEGTTNVN